ncbi:MAG TPA: metal ABC transporter substrate-binding protein [Mycobacteriales bacterium]|jgi:zinc transport system substrate-binding protein|nr:metal ABC transporter substrate-binding protein [Mycobacteriales bacterium]
MYKSLRLAATVTALGLTAACGGQAGARAGGAHIEAVAAFYPLEYVTEQVGGDHVHVDNLVPPGTEPHDLELSPKQVASLGDAGLVVYLSGFQPAVDEAVAGQAADRSLDVTTAAPLLEDAGHGQDGHDHGHAAKDPHLWLDPTRLAAVADAVAARLAKVDAGHAAEFTANAEALRAKLTALDTEYRNGLAKCASRDIVVSHEAFGYLADRYDLHQVGITGLSPDQEPTAARLAEVARIAKAENVDVIFFETLVSPRIAETLAREVGARAEVLDPLEGLEPGSTGDYISVMRSNLTTLRSALGCT